MVAGERARPDHVGHRARLGGRGRGRVLCRTEARSTAGQAAAPAAARLPARSAAARLPARSAAAVPAGPSGAGHSAASRGLERTDRGPDPRRSSQGHAAEGATSEEEAAPGRPAQARGRRQARGSRAETRGGGLGAPTPRARETAGSSAGESARKVVPFVAAAAVAALFVLGLGLVPAYVVPWYRMSVVLEDHRQQFAFVGGMALLASGIFFALTFLSG